MLKLAGSHVGKDGIVPIYNQIRPEVICDPDTARCQLAFIGLHGLLYLYLCPCPFEFTLSGPARDEVTDFGAR